MLELYSDIDFIEYFTEKCTFHVTQEVKIKIKIRDQIIFMQLFQENIYIIAYQM